jgi:hypothetical protein
MSALTYLATFFVHKYLTLEGVLGWQILRAQFSSSEVLTDLRW